MVAMTDTIATNIAVDPNFIDSSKATILIVDDTPENLDLMISLLRDVYTVKVAKSGAKALALAASDSIPDLILLDIMMPEMDGYEVCRRLKANPSTKDIPIIFLTAKTAIEDEEKGLKVGAVDYITKPISPPIVLARVETHLKLKARADFLRDKAEFLEREMARRSRQVSSIHKVSVLTSGGSTVLVVDDTPENLELMSGLLKDSYTVKVAKSGAKALGIVALDPQPDLILLDVMMPEMDGYEVCRRLKANPSTKDIPVIFLTANAGAEHEMKGLELGAVDYIAKPISPPIVLARVETHLKLKTSADFLRDKAEFLEQEAIWTQLAMEVGQVVFWQVDLTDESITYLGNPSEIENSSLPDKQGSVNVASPLGPIRMGLSERLSVLDPQEAIRINELIHQAAKTGEPFEFVYRILNDGDECVERWIASRAKPILSVSGGPISIIMGASMDITDLRRAQEDAKSAREEARQAHAARKELLARMTQDSRKFL